MLELLELFFRDYMPHGICLQWNPVLIGAMVLGDVSIGLAYVVFTALSLLFLFSTPKREQPEHSISIWLAAFIFFCGIGHFIKTANIWTNQYQLEAVWGIVTGVVSWRCVLLVLKAKKQIESKYTSTEKIKILQQELALLKIENKGLKDALDLGR